MKKSRRAGKRGLRRASTLFTKVIVFSLCVSLTLGSTAFASLAADSCEAVSESADSERGSDNTSSNDSASSSEDRKSVV